MPREAFPDRNVVEVYDTLSDTEMEFYCDIPTDAQRLAWSNAAERKGRKIVITAKTFKKQTMLAAEITNGFRKGDHTVHGSVISSDESDPAYYKDWKPMMIKQMPDILRAVGQKMFASVASKKNEEQDGIDVVIEDLGDPDFAFDDSEGDAAAASPAVSTSGATEATPAVNP
ncbi:hypothetical protein K9F62_10300 [Desulfovibrio sp. JY]|nr:hypothetical protein K9F62_10300 [Desulfovibrio sp. JY]